jgi:hypothetical protein
MIKVAATIISAIVTKTGSENRKEKPMTLGSREVAAADPPYDASQGVLLQYSST